MGDADTSFDDWQAALADTVSFAQDADCHPAVVQTLAAMLGAPRREEWRENGPTWLHMGSDAPWNQAALDAAAAVPPADLAQCIQRVFSMHLRFEQMRHSRLDLPLFKRAWPPGSRRPGYQRAAWAYVGWASGRVVEAALRRKPELTDEAAIAVLRTLQRALLHWAADHVSEPDLPMKEMLAWAATHRFTLVTQAAAIGETLARIIDLVPAAFADDRKYTGHLMKSVEALRAQAAEPAPPKADAIAPRAEAYPAARFHRDWDSLAKPEMTRLGFERVKGSVSRWRKPVGSRWLHVGFHPSKWGWARHSGSSFSVAVELSVAVDPAAVDSRDGVHVFSAYSDAEFAPFLALNERTADTLRRLSFADEFTRRQQENLLLNPSRRSNKRVPGDMTPKFEFYDPSELADWAQALVPTLGAKLEQAIAGGA